jgi:hypothetical protein
LAGGSQSHIAVTVGDTVVMQLPGIILLVALAAAMVAATGWVVFNVGRVVICVIRDVRKARRPQPQLQDPRLGMLTYDMNLWNGRTHKDGRDVRFYIAGTESGPDSSLLAQLHAVLERLPETERLCFSMRRAQAPIAWASG